MTTTKQCNSLVPTLEHRSSRDRRQASFKFKVMDVSPVDKIDEVPDVGWIDL